jgi:hypothetical protein
VTKKKRAKNEPTKGDLLAQNYRNLAAMQRVYEGAVHGNRAVRSETIQRYYWTPRDMRKGVN